LNAKETGCLQKVNRIVSFNVIKTQAFVLLTDGLAAEAMLQRLPLC